MPVKGKFKLEEIDYIRQNCLSQTDEQMSKALHRDIRTIASYRKKLGIHKGKGGTIAIVKPGVHQDETVLLASKRLSEDERKEFFKTQLSNSLYYKNLKQQFTEDELDFYLEEWGSLCLQFEDIVATEKRQIDEYIKAQIMGNRSLRNINIAETEIEKLTHEIDEFRQSHDMEDDEEAQERDIQLVNLIRTMHSQCSNMNDSYQKNVDLKNKLLNELNARRRDRIDQITKKGTTFLGLIQAFREKDTRETQGRHMELVRMAKEKKKSEWRKPIMFMDGTKDCILVDEHSNLSDEEINNSLFCKEFSEDSGKVILVVDNDIRRTQFFADIFPLHQVDFASNVDKANTYLSTKAYDLICLDYDLGLDQKGIDVVEFLLNNGAAVSSKILIHSMNKDGSNKMFEPLVDMRETEVCPFESIVKSFKSLRTQQNAEKSIPA